MAKKLTEDMAKKLTEKLTAQIGYIEPVKDDGETYFLVEEAYPDYRYDWDKPVYRACAVRLGDEIDEEWGMIHTHTLYWKVKTPKDLGYRICGDTTVINRIFEQREMQVDDLQAMYGSIHICDDGEYIPIEKPNEDGGIISCLSVRFDDAPNDDDKIKIYSVSWFASDDEIPENVSQHNGRQVVDYDGSPGKRYVLNDIDVNGYTEWYDRFWEVSPEDECDWETMYYVDEENDYMDIEEDIYMAKNITVGGNGVRKKTKYELARENYTGFKGDTTWNSIWDQVPEQLIDDLSGEQLALVCHAIHDAYHKGRRAKDPDED